MATSSATLFTLLLKASRTVSCIAAHLLLIFFATCCLSSSFLELGVFADVCWELVSSCLSCTLIPQFAVCMFLFVFADAYAGACAYTHRDMRCNVFNLMLIYASHLINERS